MGVYTGQLHSSPDSAIKILMVAEVKRDKQRGSKKERINRTCRHTRNRKDERAAHRLLGGSLAHFREQDSLFQPKKVSADQQAVLL